MIGLAQKGVRIGYIDTDYILENVPEYQEVNQQLNSNVEQWKEEIENREKEIKNKRDILNKERILLTVDLNFKVYRETEFGKVWGGLSYRRSFEGAEYLALNDQVKSQKLQYITPLVGVDFENFVFAYTYSYQSNSIVFDNGGYHQITLGINLGCKKQKYDCNCPGIN